MVLFLFYEPDVSFYGLLMESMQCKNVGISKGSFTTLKSEDPRKSDQNIYTISNTIDMDEG